MATYLANALGSSTLNIPKTLVVGDILRFQRTTTGSSGSKLTFNIPVSGVYRITARGASGGSNTGTGGRGALIQGDFVLTKDDLLTVLVGYTGVYGINAAGGGGGSFIIKGTEPILVAGGGGGGSTYDGTPQDGRDASLTTEGTKGGPGGSAGTNGNGGAGGVWGQAGGGYYTDGIGDTYGTPGKSFLNGGLGGTGYYDGGTGAGAGGFGGGGGAGFAGGGGGGGYSGGAGSGGGGGSLNTGLNQSNGIYTSRTYGQVDFTLLEILGGLPLELRIAGTLKEYDKGWVRANGQLREIDKMWTKINGSLKEV